MTHDPARRLTGNPFYRRPPGARQPDPALFIVLMLLAGVGIAGLAAAAAV